MKFSIDEIVVIPERDRAEFGWHGVIVGVTEQPNKDAGYEVINPDGIKKHFAESSLKKAAAMPWTVTSIGSPNMHDSGTRQEFTTGAVRDAAGDKPRPDLFSPFALERIGKWLGTGAQKYSERNWEKGMPISRVIASLMRHLLAYMMGKKDEDHMAAVATNAMFILHYEAMMKRGVLPAELNDMPNYQGDKNDSGM
jgi:hypothetical protein